MFHANRRTVRIVAIGEIHADDENLRPRVDLCANTVNEYVHAMRSGSVFPPLLAYEDGKSLWLAEGYHRLAAAKEIGAKTIVVEVRAGSRDDAVWAACGANVTHGLRRTNKDKQLSVVRALAHPKAQRLSDRQLARHCGVHHHTVGRVRAQLEQSGAICETTERFVRRADSIYRQNVGGIQRSNAQRRDDACAGAESTSSSLEDSCSSCGAADLPMNTDVQAVDALLREAENKLSAVLDALHTVARGPADGVAIEPELQFSRLSSAREQLRSAARMIADVLGMTFGISSPNTLRTQTSGPFRQIKWASAEDERAASPPRN